MLRRHAGGLNIAELSHALVNKPICKLGPVNDPNYPKKSK